MKLYVATGSTHCRKALATALYLEIPFEKEIVAFFSEDFDQEALLKLNPNGMVPILRDNDFLLWESTAIIQYLAELKPDADLYPDNPQVKADITRWMAWSISHFGAACDKLNWELVLKKWLMQAEPDQQIVDSATEGFLKFGQILDRHLHNRSWISHNKFSIADIALAAPLTYVEAAKLPWKNFSNLKRWYSRICEQDAWQQTMPVEVSQFT